MLCHDFSENLLLSYTGAEDPITATLLPDWFVLPSPVYGRILFHTCSRIYKALTAQKPKLFKSIASTKASNTLTKESAAIELSRLNMNNWPLFSPCLCILFVHWYWIQGSYIHNYYQFIVILVINNLGSFCTGWRPRVWAVALQMRFVVEVAQGNQKS